MERIRRFVFWVVFVLGLFGYRFAFAQKVVTVDVVPKVAFVNPYGVTTFRFRWQIEPSEDNRRYALMYTCGAELHSSQGELDKNSPRTRERFVDLTVLEDCEFMACVIKVVKGEIKLKTICDRAYVKTGGEK